MRSKTLDSRIQFQPLATLRASELAKPIQQLPAKSLRPGLLVGHEVIHITKTSPNQAMQHPEACHGCNLLLMPDESDPIPLSELPANNRNKLLLFKVRTQLRHHSPAISNVGVGLGSDY